MNFVGKNLIENHSNAISYLISSIFPKEMCQKSMYNSIFENKSTKLTKTRSKSQLTLANATCGNFWNHKSASSPFLPCNCPWKILAAVNVVKLIPSPKKKMIFFATFVFCFRYKRSFNVACA